MGILGVFFGVFWGICVLLRYFYNILKVFGGIWIFENTLGVFGGVFGRILGHLGSRALGSEF